MQSMVMNSTASETDFVMNDLGPLAWVLDELRKSLEGATKALKRFARDAEAARGSDLAAIDASQLRVARQQLHQAVGALEMVGLAGPALVLRAMETAVQKFVQQPEHCSQDAVAKIEYASFALTEYLEGVLADKPVSAVSLFPQYRDVQELVHADRIHPADLWPFEWRWVEPQQVLTTAPRHYDTDARSMMDQSVLQLMKGKAPQAGLSLRNLSLGFSAQQTEQRHRIFWLLAAAYFEAVANDLLGSDIYVRRAASRILLQYASLAKGDTSISERLALDLLFFCAQAVSSRASDTPILSAVRAAYGLTKFRPVNYELVQFGRFDPALVAQARKRIVSAKEAWSSLCAGEITKAKLVADQFSLVTDSLRKLHARSEPLAQALTRAIDTTLRTGNTPGIQLAMEVATSVLYLEAVFEDLDPDDPQLAGRTASLADRLEGVRVGGEFLPLESWMEELYRRVSDKQTMGSVVGELRVSLGELEKSLDLFFRNPQDKTSLQAVPGQLSNMRGVFSVLGLDQASRAVLGMRGSVEQILGTEIDEQLVRAAGTFEHLGNNLGALSFLVNMLNYQPALAKKLFVYDEEKGELKPLMGRSQNAGDATSSVTVNNNDPLLQELVAVVHEVQVNNPDNKLSDQPDMFTGTAKLADRPEPVQIAGHTAVVLSDDNAKAGKAAEFAALATVVLQVHAAPDRQTVMVDFEKDDLRDIFLEEAREVIGNAQQAIETLVRDPVDVEPLTVLRRAFHTLKGSARMVGLAEFGEAAWALEQMLNSWLADQKAATKEFRTLSFEVIAGFEHWIAAIAANQDASWSAAPFRSSAEAMRIEGRYSVFDLSGKARNVLMPSPVIEAVASDAHELRAAGKLPDAPEVPKFLLAFNARVGPATEFGIIFDAELAGAPDTNPAYQAATPVPEVDEPDFDRLFAVSSDSDGRVSSVPVDMSEQDVLSGLSPVRESMPATESSEFDIDQDFQLKAVTSETVAPFVLGKTPATVELEQVAALPEAAVTLEPTQPEPEADIVKLNSADLDDASDGLIPVFAVDSNEEETVKVIDGLRIGIPLYNVYLNEADEWSRRLVNEVAEWALESYQPVSSSTVALAHSLAGSSATVGFHALSGLARLLERALQNSRNHHSHGASTYGQVFVDASEDIRRLLHQFAAGFLKQPRPDILERLNQLEFSDSVLSEVYDDGLYFLTDPASVDKAKSEPQPAPLPAAEVDIIVRAERGVKTEPAVEAESTAKESLEAKSGVKVVEGKVQLPAAASAGIPALAFHEEDDDDIDAVDAIDPDLFPIFEEECAELMPRLGSALRQWAERPDNQGARLEVLRVLHTLKGSARLAGALRLGEMAHRIESEISYVGSDAAASQEFESLLTRFDGMQTTFDALRRVDNAALETPENSVETEQLTALSSESQNPASLTLQTGAVAFDAIENRTNVDADTNTDVDSISIIKPAIPAPQVMAMRPLRQAATASIRVRTQLLDRMVNQVGEVMITRARLESEIGQLRDSLNDMSSNLTRLRQQLRDIELQAETQMQSRLALAKEAQAGFDPLEFDRFTRVQELTRMMAESVSDVATVQRTLQRTVEATEDDLIAQGRQTRELQRDLLRTRMVEFEGMSERLYRVVRQASKETGKQVRLDLLGGNLEMDRGMLDRMMPAFEHLLRNCVTHGIEDPQVRVDALKDPVGLITIHLRQEGNDVSIDFSDDGGGLDLQRIREKALSAGLRTVDQLLDDQAAAELIFLPGFSTAVQVTELAGRGIGMEVVRSEVNALGGRIETSTVFGEGTHFKLVLPLTTAVTQVVMIRAGSLSVGVPSNVVETVRRVSVQELQQAYSTGTLDVNGEAVPFFWSGALLQASHYSSEAQTKSVPVVIFRSAAQRIALHVDEVLGNREVVVKNLGPQLSRLPGLAGMSVLPSGSVVLIYNPVALAVVFGQQARAWSTDRAAELHSLEGSGNGATNTTVLVPVAPEIPLILVVDDSITVRRVTQRLLLREGYRVAMAADGLQALERLQEEVPAVVLSDIEMPRMDGFDLARNIRADARLKRLPIIMITSRSAQKHREHATELGINHYLGKPYSEDELIRLVQHYCSVEAAVPA